MPQIRALFSNIQQYIANEIQQASTHIRIAMAWLTDQNLYDLLCNKAITGIKVELLLIKDDINKNAFNIDLEQLRQINNAEIVFMVPEDFRKMHNKYVPKQYSNFLKTLNFKVFFAFFIEGSTAARFDF